MTRSSTSPQTATQWRALCARDDLVANSGVVAWLDGEQVAGRVAADDQLGQDHQVCALFAGPGDGVGDASGVGGEVADGGVELGEGDLHGGW